MQIPQALSKIVEGNDLSQEETAEVFRQIMSGEATAGQIGAILAALRVKGETPAEIAGAAITMRDLSTKVPVTSDVLVDTCGTGGSGSKLFNISTAAAFVAASAWRKSGKTRQSKDDQFQWQRRCFGGRRCFTGAHPGNRSAPASMTLAWALCLLRPTTALCALPAQCARKSASEPS
jgi:hypothetical protein